jgi:hypothetical protein
MPSLLTYDAEGQTPPTDIRACLDSEDDKAEDDSPNELPVDERRGFCAPLPDFEVQVSRTPAKDPAKVVQGPVLGAATMLQNSLAQMSQSNSTGKRLLPFCTRYVENQ